MVIIWRVSTVSGALLEFAYLRSMCVEFSLEGVVFYGQLFVLLEKYLILPIFRVDLVLKGFYKLHQEVVLDF
jgi:hypothetical protein